jgi:hypothetical protein
MTDPARASGPSGGPSAAPSAAQPHDTTPDTNTGSDAARAAEAKKTIDASRQAGVVNPGELAKDVGKAYKADPKDGAELHAAVNEQLSPRDQASLNEHLAPTIGAVAGANSADATAAARDRAQTVTAYRVEGAGNQRVQIGSDGSVQVPEVRTNKGRGPERNLYLNFGDEARAKAFHEQRLQQFPDNTIKSFEVPRSFVNELRANAVPESERAANPDKPVIADPTKASDQFGLSGKQIEQLRDVTGNRPAPSALATTAHTAGRGALVGAATDAALTTAGALRDGRISGDEARDIVANSARGAVVGGTYAVTEQGLVKVADRAAGAAVERTAANVATRLGTADASAAAALTRTAATRLGGAGAAGAVISAGMSIYENRDGLANGDSRAIGNVAGDTVVGAGSALAGAAAGAAIGSAVPVLGTAVGAVVGLGVGFAADYVMRAGGVDKVVGNAVTSSVDAVKGAASKVAGWFGW